MVSILKDTPMYSLVLSIFLFASYITHTNAHPLALRDDTPLADSNPPDPRTVYSIVYSCFATIFLCTWVSFHPNIPAVGESSVRITLKRIKNMLYALLFPELMLCWAMNQWFGARRMSKEFKAQGWTNTHSFFLQMGGFHYCDGEGVTRILEWDDLSNLIGAEEIRKMVELVTVEDIQDRSKSDFLSKALAVIQTTWFIAQCIARGVQGLALAELELLTVALAALNGFMYFFWWSKPMDVRSPILLHCEPCRSHALREEESEFKRLTSGRTSEPEKITSTSLLEWSPQPKPKQQKLNTSTTISLNPFKLMWFVICGCVSDLDDLLSPEGDVERDAKTVPEYFAVQDKNSKRIRLIFIGFIGSAFGGLHLVAWNFIFPDRTAWLLWQSAAIIITVAPLVLGVVAILTSLMDHFDSTFTSRLDNIILATGGIIIVAYVAARFILIVEALVLLKHLPPSAYTEIEWTHFIPHI